MILQLPMTTNRKCRSPDNVETKKIKPKKRNTVSINDKSIIPIRLIFPRTAKLVQYTAAQLGNGGALSPRQAGAGTLALLVQGMRCIMDLMVA
jgi:hypothetical protein